METMFRHGLAILLICGSSLTGWAGFEIDIRPSAALASNTQALNAFQTAANRWKAIFTDDVTVRIDADFRALGSGILGQAGSSIHRENYTTARTAMVNDAAPYADNAIVAALPVVPTFDAPSGKTVSTTQLDMTRANAKALGLVNRQSTSTDATITFNDSFTFDFDPSDGITSGAFDFVAIAAHEIGHALGFISSVDDFDRGDSFTVATTLDMFRFQNNTVNDPSTPAEFTIATRSMRPGVDAIFDDTTNEYRMSTGANTGDGRQASHWKDGLGIGLMDPTLAPGERGVITEADIRAFDLIGWDRVAAVPEPSSLVTLSTVAGLWLLRRRKRAS